MARPPLGLGKHGSIRITHEGGQWVARCRFRQLNGATVRVERWGSSKTAATHNLQDELRNRAGERTTMLSASSRFADAAEIYLTKIAERREGSTYDIYRYWMDAVVLPALGELRIHECDVAQFDVYFTDLQRRGYAANTRRTLRAIVVGTMQQAVLAKAAPSNPVRELERIEEPKGKRKAQPRGLTIEERRRLLGWLDGTSDDPKVARKQKVARAADLPDLIRFALGTGLRISEVCGVRICDLDLDGVPVVSGDDIRLVPIVAVRGKVCYIKGKGWCAATPARPPPRCGSSHCLDSSPSGFAPGSPAMRTRCDRCSRQPASTAARHSGGRRTFGAVSVWFAWRPGSGG